MSPYMVPENHQEIFSTQWNQGEILVYFGTIYMEHPVIAKETEKRMKMREKKMKEVGQDSSPAPTTPNLFCWV